MSGRSNGMPTKAWSTSSAGEEPAQSMSTVCGFVYRSEGAVTVRAPRHRVAVVRYRGASPLEPNGSRTFVVNKHVPPRFGFKRSCAILWH
jgi:hypothetical protein